MEDAFFCVEETETKKEKSTSLSFIYLLLFFNELLLHPETHLGDIGHKNNTKDFLTACLNVNVRHGKGVRWELSRWFSVNLTANDFCINHCCL